MKLTKYGHACVVLEEQGKKLVIDPGDYTDDFGDLENILAVVATHIHNDHLGKMHIKRILGANPDIKVFTTAEAAEELNDPHITTVAAADGEAIGPFNLRFFGKLHKAVHPDWPVCQNIGVLVNDSFYYPGDSFTTPDKAVKVLAVPASANWLKMSEAIDFIRKLKPRQFFRTHDRLLSEQGISGVNDWLEMAADKFGSQYVPLDPGQSIEF
jgi:L-ascorbate metabolism protein UlaG (beta-lactamase superfamily)